MKMREKQDFPLSALASCSFGHTQEICLIHSFIFLKKNNEKGSSKKKYLESNERIIFVTVCARMVFFSLQKATKSLIGHAPFLSEISG